jgi:hypothetical protein
LRQAVVDAAQKLEKAKIPFGENKANETLWIHPENTAIFRPQLITKGGLESVRTDIKAAVEDVFTSKKYTLECALGASVVYIKALIDVISAEGKDVEETLSHHTIRTIKGVRYAAYSNNVGIYNLSLWWMTPNYYKERGLPDEQAYLKKLQAKPPTEDVKKEISSVNTNIELYTAYSEGKDDPRVKHLFYPFRLGYMKRASFLPGDRFYANGCNIIYLGKEGDKMKIYSHGIAYCHVFKAKADITTVSPTEFEWAKGEGPDYRLFLDPKSALEGIQSAPKSAGK